MRRKAQLLRHQSQARSLRLPWLAHHLDLAIQRNRAAVRLDDSHQNLDQRALARAVLAAKSANFTPT